MALLLWFTSCSKDAKIDGPRPSERIRFELFAKADSYGVPVTRAAADENGVDQASLWVMVFSGADGNATFVEAVRAEKSDNKIYVNLISQPSNCQLLLLANHEAEFYIGDTGYEFSKSGFDAAFTDATTLSYVRDNMLSMPLSSPQTSVPFVGKKLPMSSVVSVSKIAPNTIIPQFELKRTAGRVTVKNEAANFTLKGITAVVNTPKQARWYNPDVSLSYNTGSGKIVEYNTGNGYGTDIALAENNTTQPNPVYLYESACDEDDNDTYLIIRGRYGSRAEDSFYKMAFIDNDRSRLDIWRNCEYSFTIKAVKSPGYSTVEDAKLSASSNNGYDNNIHIAYSVFVYDNYSYEIMANNEYYIGVSNSHFELYAPYDNTAEYTAFSLVTDCVSMPSDKRNVKSLTNGMTVTAPAGGKIPINTASACDVKIKVEDGFTEGQIELRMENLKKIITVRRFEPVAPNTTIGQFHPSADVRYLSAYVVDYPMTGYDPVTPEPSYWLQLSPGGEPVRNDPHHVYVDRGAISLHVGDGAGASGDVYVSARTSPTTRIKIHVTQ